MPSAEATWVAAPLRLGRSAWDSLFTLLFPVQCRVCEQPLEVFTTAPVCADCLAAPQPYQGIECFRCGRFLSSGAALRGSARQGTSYCGVCRRNAVQRDGVQRNAVQHALFAFEQARSFGAYEGTLQSLIQRLKYDGYRPLAKPLGRFLAEAARRLEEQSFDLLIPVPLHPRRQRQRGFNQAALLAAEVSKFLNIPSGAKDCVRVRDTRPQTGLRAAERRKNVAGAFDVPEPERVRGRRVLLIDDVLTTGATAHACAQALRKAGARGVWVGTLARAHPARDDVL
ncbi:MAG: hypothetical protein A3H28_06065 [Acidobacteria bacterium RIFCSPLOWO2_02_FULL_61_28]|nr:MAG: hypothetical protein A3H28_06065 [Acidobacteria bacterium RIFCSPLOWO2_02_FULL_61_28]